MVVKVSKPALNLREKLSELFKPSGIAGEAMLRADTVAEQQALIGVGRRNILVNGSFQISQRGDYSSPSNTSTNSYVFKLDRWNNHTVTINSTVQHLSGFPTTNEKYVRTVATSTGSGYMRMFQRVEGNFEGRELTFSAWVRSNRQTRLLTIATGAWVSNDTSARHSGNGQWEKLTLTVTAGNMTSPHFVISNNAIDHGTTSVVTGDYFEVANCQLEEGKIATPFEHRSYGEELALCQRYYWQIGDGINSRIVGVGGNFGSTWAYFTGTFPTKMRVIPTSSVNNNTYFRCHSPAGSGIGTTGFGAPSEISESQYYISFSGAASFTPGATNLCFTQNGSNYGIIKFDAEL
jgi:hypothetical protein